VSATAVVDQKGKKITPNKRVNAEKRLKTTDFIMPTLSIFLLFF